MSNRRRELPQIEMIPEGAPFRADELFDADGDIPDNDDVILTPNSFADDMGNLVGEEKQFIVGD